MGMKATNDERAFDWVDTCWQGITKVDSNEWPGRVIVFWISSNIKMPHITHMLSANDGNWKVFSWCICLVNITESVHDGNAVVMHV